MSQPAEAAPSFPEELQEYYTQEVSWSECGDGYQCTEVTVPMDYDEPDGETISIALKVLEASGQSHGPLLVNPGGPGGSGLELVENAQSMFGAPLRENFDLVGFDPRGVGESTAVRCYDSDQLDEFYSQDYDMTTDGGFDAFEQDMRAFGQACEQNTGELVHHLDTVSAARDMDVLRGVLGQQQLSYLGFSYGTYLGATYADLFPQKVGRFVLDGAIDPALSYAEVTRGQVKGFDKAYRAYLAHCLDNDDCPFSGTVDEAVDQTAELAEQLADTPVPSGDPDRPTTASDLYNAITIALYNPVNWPVLSGALQSLLDKDDGGQIKFLSDFANERDQNGQYPPDTGAFRLIDCSDYPVDPSRGHSRELADDNAEQSDLFGRALSFGEVACGAMPVEADRTHEPVHAEGAPPIVVIGTTGDPATPYQWAVSLADQLSAGVLITYEGQGHTAYGGQNQCVNQAVEAYLIQGEVPDDGLTC